MGAAWWPRPQKAVALLTGCVLCWSCEGPTPKAGDTVVAVAQAGEQREGMMQLSSSIRFADGTVVRDIELAPAPAVAGQRVTVRFRVEGSAMAFRVGLLPARHASHQVAVGGVDAPAPSLPEDPRARFVQAQPVDGRVEVAIEVPSPWHSGTAVLTVQARGIAGDPPAIRGPRLRQGQGVLAVLPIQWTPFVVSVAHFAASPSVDGALDEPAWSQTDAHQLVQSTDGEPTEEARTLVRMGWDEQYLYMGAVLDDADLRSSFLEHDDPLWKEEAFELFVFGDERRARYLEFQVSPRGVTFDARFEEYRRADEAWDSAWRTAVDARGSVDDATDVDRGWTVEAAIPWEEICTHTEVVCPPRPGMRLRANVFRLERPAKGATIGLALSPPGVPDFHAPQRSAVLELAP